MAAPSSKSFNLIHVDDHPIVNFGVKALLEETESIRLIASAATAADAITLARQHQPDLIVLDLVLGGRSGLELIPELLSVAENAGIIVYSALDERLYAQRAFAAGARGYVMKEAGLLALLEAIRTVAQGVPYASDAIKRALLEKSIKGKATSSPRGIEALSNQELYIFRLIGSGLSSSAIAEQLGISPKTVSSHRERIKNKLGLQTSRELERIAEEAYL